SVLVFLVLFLAPGYLLHVSPRFAGSFPGTVLGITAAMLMLALLVYPLVKYVTALRRALMRVVSLGTLLSFHIYAGVIGALLGILHSGHSYRSPVGFALVASMLVVVITGYVGRFYLTQVSADLRNQQAALSTLRTDYNVTAAALAGTSGAAPAASLPRTPVLSLVEEIADLEYAIVARNALKRTLSVWIVLHVTASIVLYGALVIHIWSEVYYGLRWLD